MKKMMKRKNGFARVSILFLVCLFLVLSAGSAGGQAELASFTITRVDASRYPLIDLQVATRDAEGKPVIFLPEANLRVTEDNVPTEVTNVSTVETGIRIAFVIDVGDGLVNTGVSLKTVYEIASEYIDTFVVSRPWMKSGVDEVTVLVQEGMNTRTIAPMTNNPQIIADSMAAYVPPPDDEFMRAPKYGDFTKEALKRGMDELSYSPGGEDRQKALVLFTPGVRADLAEQAERAINARIPIYVVSARPDPNEYWETALPPLAEVTHGEYFTHYGSDSLEPIFERITTQRSQYLISYQSPTTSTGGRQVLLEIAMGTQSWSASTQYNVVIEPPTVEIQTPGPGSLITRNIIEERDDDPVVAPQYVTVRATIAWPDGYPRPIRQAQLLVDNTPVAQAQVVESGLDFTWDISSYNTEARVPALLQVVIEDELGLRGSSAPFTVSVEYIGSRRPTDERNGPSAEMMPIYLLTGVSLLALGMSSFLFFNRARVGPVLHQAQESIVDFVERVTGRRTALMPRAYLVPLEGIDERPIKNYELFGTTSIGRSRRHADLLFHITDENSPISRLHCTLLDEDDHFAIRDEDSTNGTLVNNEMLTPLETVAVRDGDIIDVAPLERGGIRFLFQLAGLDGEMADLDDQIRHTQPRRHFEFDPPRRGSVQERG